MLYKEINSMKIRTIVIFLFLLAMLILVVVMKDYVSSLSTSVEAMEKSPGAKWAEKFTGQSLEQLFKKMQSNNFYIWSQWYAKNFGQFLPLISLIIAFPLFARETEKKTIYFLLSRKKRKEIFKVKSLTGLAATIIIIFLLSILAPVLMDMFGKSVDWSPIWKYTVQDVVAGVFFYSVYLFFSIFFNDTVKVIIAGIVFFIGDFMMGLIQQLSFLNLFGYIASVHVFKTGKIDWNYTIWIVLISELIYFASMKYFYKKDY